MEHSTRLAHISEGGTRTQTVYDHLAGTARLAGSFAAPFGAQSEAEFAAWLHDVGKYSDAFQLRLKGGPKVDHSTAGAHNYHNNSDQILSSTKSYQPVLHLLIP